MKSNIYSKLESFFNNHQLEIDGFHPATGVDYIVSIANHFQYSDENIALLETDIVDTRTIESRFPKLYENLIGCNHNRDKRTPFQYGQDLVASWVFEDCLLHQLETNGLDLSLNGTDKNREILASKNVSANSDYIVTYKDFSAFIELANDYTGYWTRNHCSDLRDSKWKHIKDLATPNSPSLLLGLDFVGNAFFLIDTNDPAENVKYIPSHWPYGGKPAYSIGLNDDNFTAFSFQNVATAIINKMH